MPCQDVDCAIRDAHQVVGLPVVLEARRPAGVSEGLDGRVRTAADEVHERLGEMPQRSQVALGLVQVATVHAEVASPAAYSPHQIVVLMIRDVQETSVGGHDVGADKVVRREAEAARQMSESAANSESGDAGCGYDPTRHGQPEGLGLIVNVAPYAARVDICAAPGWVDANRV